MKVTVCGFSHTPWYSRWRAETGGETSKVSLVFVNGKRWPGSPAALSLARHAEIVLEVGPHVPPHPSCAFPAGS